MKSLNKFLKESLVNNHTINKNIYDTVDSLIIKCLKTDKLEYEKYPYDKNNNHVWCTVDCRRTLQYINKFLTQNLDDNGDITCSLDTSIDMLTIYNSKISEDYGKMYSITKNWYGIEIDKYIYEDLL